MKAAASSKFYVEALMGLSTMTARGISIQNSAPYASLFPYNGFPRYDWYLNPGYVKSSSSALDLGGALNFGIDLRAAPCFLIGGYLGIGMTGAHCSLPYRGDFLRQGPIEGVTIEEELSNFVDIRDSLFLNTGLRMGVMFSKAFAFFRVGYAPHYASMKIERLETIPETPILQNLEPYDGPYKLSNVKKRVRNFVSALAIGVGLEYSVSPCFILGVLVETHIARQKTWHFKNGISKLGLMDTYQPRYNMTLRFNQFFVTMKYPLYR